MDRDKQLRWSAKQNCIEFNNARVTEYHCNFTVYSDLDYIYSNQDQKNGNGQLK